ncbi:MAG: GatB/YqeY domain-containing protein [Bacteroidales bacterium]|nr:GatB/YqeY domain-containing protein [Bacteroidales bacterium]MDZ4204614.1 GatB/YqeY domain-containing protein [Bacteroidales bacterium]
MSLENTINNDIKAAMLAKDAARLEALRAVKAALLIEKTKGGASGEPITTEDELRLLQKLVKQRKESAEIFKSNGRVELAATEEFQAGVIESYLPEQFDTEKVRSIVKEIILQTGAQSIKDMGRVMGEASRQLAGKADNKTIAALVKELLPGS